MPRIDNLNPHMLVRVVYLRLKLVVYNELKNSPDSELFLDSVGGGAWPFLVGGVICLVNSDNERDSVLLNSCNVTRALQILLRGTGGI